ncbi:type II toxin-antitoxin system RelB/DinJ family antitoxin [Candidatus Saccharibacteria bacterium]|nr:type II toxin-antitoxin system RelB/DinJ family antitoxin [Candidatus Saccharibacteria bacterium]
MALRTATIHTRIQPELKRNAEEIFEKSGHTASDVLEQFYVLTVKNGKVPIRLTKRRAKILDENLNTPEEIQAALKTARKSAAKQIKSGEYITTKEVRRKMKTKYGINV